MILAIDVGNTNIVLVVGIQGLVEWITGCIVAGGVTKAVAHALKRD